MKVCRLLAAKSKQKPNLNEHLIQEIQMKHKKYIDDISETVVDMWLT